jgi:CRP/FNR family transcriptional regulator, cyclic AMP receptor protein
MTVASLKGVYLFRDLDATELHQLESFCGQQVVASGDDVFRHGDPARAFYVIHLGTVRIHRESATIDEIEVAMLGTGAHFGELAWLTREKRSATATAQERTELLRLDYDAMMRLVEQNPRLGVKVYRALARAIAGMLHETTDDLIFAREMNARQHQAGA